MAIQSVLCVNGTSVFVMTSLVMGLSDGNFSMFGPEVILVPVAERARKANALINDKIT